jgi:hypothetical protein
MGYAGVALVRFIKMRDTFIRYLQQTHSGFTRKSNLIIVCDAYRTSLAGRYYRLMALASIQMILGTSFVIWLFCT